MRGNSSRTVRPFAFFSAASHSTSVLGFLWVVAKAVPETRNFPCRGQSNPSALPVLSSACALDPQIGQTASANDVLPWAPWPRTISAEAVELQLEGPLG